VTGASRIEGSGTRWAPVSADEVFVDRQLNPARATKDRLLGEFIPRPNGWFVICNCRVTIEARIPAAAAVELDRDDIDRRVPVTAAGLSVNFDSVNLAPVDNSHE